MPKTIIVSNRLPVKISKDKETQDLQLTPSAGGLATGLGSIYKKGNNVWIGWPGLYLDSNEQKQDVSQKLRKDNMQPVFLTEEEIRDYYEGFSNETLWPNFHYFPQYVVYDNDLYEAYCQVNQKFCDAVVALAEPGDTIWVHDYQLLLLPGLLREKLPDSSIAYFQHIPFSSYEIFRMIPWRKQLLRGMLGADLIGFHTYDDMRHFLSSVSRLVGYSNAQGYVEMPTRKVNVDAFPMGIDYEKYAASAASPETIGREVRYRTSVGDVELILSIDRLDYSKGIPQRLKAFDLFLRQYPEYAEKVSLILLVVPSRDQVEKYKELKEEVDLLVGRINGEFGRMNWTPIHYFYRSFPLEALSAMYRMSHVCMVTPMRDGMNLVCKEYIASKLDQKGVLILSEMAGASKELSDAILVNPNDQHKMARALHRALTMPVQEQQKHMEVMQASLKLYNIHNWVRIFMERLEEIKTMQREMGTRKLDKGLQTQVQKRYNKAKKRLLFLDYDGTLAHFHDDPLQATPDQTLKDLLTALTNDPANQVVIISGRSHETLEEWLGHYPVDLICEHGIWLREQGKEWENMGVSDASWKQKIHPTMDLYVSRTPGSFIEEKNYSLVWHFRKVETGLGELRSRELTSHLKFLATGSGLHVLEGDMVVEVKPREVNKGRAAQIWLQRFEAEFVMAIGDDWTDEDTFKAMPEEAVTIKVGNKSSAARYYLESVDDVRGFLGKLGPAR